MGGQVAYGPSPPLALPHTNLAIRYGSAGGSDVGGGIGPVVSEPGLCDRSGPDALGRE